MNCGKYDCGWCSDESDKNNSVDGACIFPEDCDLNVEELPKENSCMLEFYCRRPEKNCVYFSRANDGNGCKYKYSRTCQSLVAQVNVMTLAIKERMGEL